jgi:hypothetical protein
MRLEVVLTSALDVYVTTAAYFRRKNLSAHID